jgi:uncharacterized membrane protein
MVQADINKKTGNGSIVLKPNQSASWQSNMMVISSLGAIALLISGFFLLQGLWMILPFSGMELLALYTGLYICVRSNETAEVITFLDNTVTIEKGRTSAEIIWEYQRSWSTIIIKTPRHRGHSKRIFIRSHGKELELGAFLNKGDKKTFISNLKNLVYCNQPVRIPR